MGEEKSNINKSSHIAHLIAGAGAGLIADSVTHPVDTIRTRMQVVRGARENAYKSLFHAFSSIVRSEGALALYKGFPAVALSTIPAHALYFAGYESAKSVLNSGSSKKPAWFVHFCAGVWADVCGAIVWVPQDVVKQRLQIQRNMSEAKYKGTMHAVSTILREEGIAGLYRGYGAALLTYGPFVGIYFLLYEESKRVQAQLLGKSDVEKLPFWAHVVGGAEAGALAAAVTCPMDVVKTRMQVQAGNSASRYRGVVHAVSSILREEGARAFVKGLSARVFWIAPSTAITISAYEQLKRLVTL